MKPVTIYIYSHTKGDKWEGLSIGPVTFDGVAPPANLSSCRMYLRDSEGTIALKFKTSPGVGEETITISNAVTWEIIVPAVVISLTPKTYYWDFETTDADSVIRTLYKGKWNILPEQTYD